MEVKQRLVNYLHALVWSVVLGDPNRVDVKANRPEGTRLFAEAKGVTSDIGTATATATVFGADAAANGRRGGAM